MCATCGCGTDEHHEHEHHEHGHHHHHDHAHPHEPRTVSFEQAILARNDRLAVENRGWLAGRGITAVNLMSSPGAGKTSLLERTIVDLGREPPIAVIEGDQETDRDAARIRAAGARAVQINTGTGCHLDAAMVARGLTKLDPSSGTLVFIENVGNLVCPALFDLGERARVVIASVTEGDDKPLKYPHMFRSADLVVLSKTDLLPYVTFDLGRFAAYAHTVSPSAQIIRLSTVTRVGLEGWYRWLREEAVQRVVAG